MNPIHAITSRLGNKGTVIAGVVLVLGLFAALDFRTISAPSPKITLLATAWQTYDRAALSRDAPDRAFDHALDPLNLQIGRLDTLTDRIPIHNHALDQAFHAGLIDLHECRAWLYTYRQSTEPNPTRDNARDHIDACSDAHPLTTLAPGRTLVEP